MKKIRIKNLRSLVDTDYIEIKPITILVGKNSVGKSTFLRSFPLLKQTMITNRSEPLLWYSPELVDFGNFDESVTGKDETKTIEFSYEFELLVDDFISTPFIGGDIDFDMIDTFRFLDKKNRMKKTDALISISVKKENISKVEISVFDYNYTILIDKKGKVTQLKVNEVVCPIKIQINQSDKFSKREIIPKIFIPVDNNKIPVRDSYSIRMMNYFYDEFSKIKGNQIGEEKFKKISKENILGTKEDFLENFLNRIKKFSSIEKNFSKLNDIEKDNFISNLYNYFGLSYINVIITTVNNYFSEYFGNSQYIAPIRATAQRYYRSQGLSIDTITPQGENVPMLLDSMSREEKDDWNDWTEKRFGIKFIVTKHETNISLKLEKNNRQINLADTGFGYSQLLPILLYAWKTSKKDNSMYYWTSNHRKKINTLVIEQPELHLHPSLQADLLDVFIELVEYVSENLEFNIIMETHSEAIINRVGQHISFNKTKELSDKVSIVIFDEVDGELQINQSSFTSEGYLERWPIDFFMPSMEGLY